VSVVETNKRANGKRKPNIFDAETFLNSAGVARTMMEFGRKETLFSQGDPSKNIMYIQKGAVKISVVSTTGKEAVVGMLGPGEFVGEGGLAGQPMRIATATAVSPVSVLVIDNSECSECSIRKVRFPIASSPICFNATSGSKRT
jgi:CRP-like cAMP-binding protein